MKIAKQIICLLFLATSGCASKPGAIPADYVSPLKYTAFSCDVLTAERERMLDSLVELYRHQNKDVSDDSAAMAVSMLLFWPALFALSGGKEDVAGALGKLKGEVRALDIAATDKGCADIIAQIAKEKKSVEEALAKEKKSAKEARKAFVEKVKSSCELLKALTYNCGSGYTSGFAPGVNGIVEISAEE